jgi:hypothetical protein
MDEDDREFFPHSAEKLRAPWLRHRSGRQDSCSQINEEVRMTNESFDSCIRACDACATACDTCGTACLTEPDVKQMADCIRLDLDCAAICRLASGYMARRSERAATICRICAEICEACAAECAKHPPEHCQRCAQACRACAEECRRMSS